MKTLVLALSAVLLIACVSAAVEPTDASETLATKVDHPEFRAFNPQTSIVAQESVDEAMGEAARSGKNAVIVMGANWCHDSRALAGWFKTPRFVTLLEENYVVTYIDVGQKDRNTDVAQRFGLDNIVGTPTVIVTDSQGEVLNFETAPTWRNAASRTEDSIFEYFSALAPK